MIGHGGPVKIIFLLARTSLRLYLLHSTPPKTSVSEYVPTSDPAKTNLLDVIVQPDMEFGHRPGA